jgi:Holliday junction resolvase
MNMSPLKGVPVSTDGGLRKMFRKRLPGVHWTTIETGIVERGVPDMHGTWKGKSFWIENKRARGLEISLRPSQIGWLLRNARSGGTAFIAVRKGKTLWLLYGGYARTLARKGLRKVPRAALAGCWPAPWPWPAILAILAL